MAAPSPHSLVGEVINTYRVLSRLGSGGMGVVYKALDLKLDRTVALKFLPLDRGATQHSRDQFLQEARAASALDHPNIGTIYGMEETLSGDLFIVMAYYEGETLAQKIRRGRMPVPEALSIAVQMARGLVEAHSRRIVHRDIKPANTVLASQGLAKIVDFGIARMVSSASATQTATMSGTAAYMSPEQCTGRPVDHRSDLWSLGAVLHEMVTGGLPFPAENVPATLFAIVSNPPAKMDEDTPLPVQQIIFKALAKDPAARYQSASEMLSDLEQLTTAATLATNSPTLTMRDLEGVRQLASGTVVRPSQASWRKVLAAVLAIPLLLASLLLIPSVRERLVYGGEKHIAVLPFHASGDDPANVALADGLMESITNRLSNLDSRGKSLWVVPASEVRRRKVTDAASARKEFGANLVVSGEVRRSAQGVRLTVNLIDAKDLRQLGSEEIHDAAGDLSAVQDSALSKLTHLMSLPLPAAVNGQSAMPEAYEAYLKALGYLQRYDRPGNTDQAISLLAGAVKSDPKFALAYASLGDAYFRKFSSDPNPAWLDRAIEYCQRSLSQSDQLTPAYVTFGRALVSKGQPELALQQFQRALVLAPRDADALVGMARAYEVQGRLKEAEENYRRAAVLRPDYWDGFNSLGMFYYRQRRLDDAAVQMRKVVQLTPDNAQAYSNLGVVYNAQKKSSEAIEAYRKSLSLSPTYNAYSNLGSLYSNQGDYPRAEQMFEKALAINERDWRLWMNLASTEEALGKAAKTADAYGRALPLLETAGKMRQQDPIIQSTLGLLYAKFHRRDDAVRHLDSALAAAPADRDVLERTSAAYETLGDRREAIGYAARAIKAGYGIEHLSHSYPELSAVVKDPKFKPTQ